MKFLNQVAASAVPRRAQPPGPGARGPVAPGTNHCETATMEMMQGDSQIKNKKVPLRPRRSAEGPLRRSTAPSLLVQQAIESHQDRRLCLARALCCGNSQLEGLAVRCRLPEQSFSLQVLYVTGL